MTTSKPKSHSETTTPAGTPVRQLSVFLHNRVGALMALVKLLSEHHVEVLGLSLQDTTELALVRLVPSDPETAEMLFIERGIPHAVCPVTVVELRETERSLAQALAALLSAEVNIDFSYPLMVRPAQHPVLVLHLDSPDVAAEVLTQAGFKVLMQEDLSR
ncbi:MAG: acetolactate synthase [Verrucomicrobiaceae bacterium]